MEVTTRVLAQVPPRPDVSPPDIKEGYWLSLVPGFPVARVLRDYPFGVEETKNPAYHALTFVDLVGADRGLLVLHAGTQYFRREASGRVSNLVMREWESHFTQEYGWPVYAEYRHGLMPHGGDIDNADRLRAAASFARPLDCVVRKPQAGDLPASGELLRRLAARPRAHGLPEGAGRRLRNAPRRDRRPPRGRGSDPAPPREPGGRDGPRRQSAGRAALRNGRLAVAADPWKILTFRLE